METNQTFPPLSPSLARNRFLVRDDSWEERFRPGFDQFIISSFEYARPVIKLPVPPGRTQNHAIFSVTAGEVSLRVGHWSGRLMAGQVALIPASQIFSIDAIRADTTGYMCFISPDFLVSAGAAAPDLLTLTNRPLLRLTDLQRYAINHIFGRLTTEYTEHGTTRTDLISPYLLTLLAELNRAYAGESRHPARVADRLVQQFMDLLTTRARQSRLVRQYADWLNVSPNHLNKVIRSRTGQSPSVWLAERVVLEAKAMLAQLDLSVAQITVELGFADQSAFGKLFMRYARMSPTAFRKMIDAD